jgi:hypothetical protein
MALLPRHSGSQALGAIQTPSFSLKLPFTFYIRNLGSRRRKKAKKNEGEEIEIEGYRL